MNTDDKKDIGGAAGFFSKVTQRYLGDEDDSSIK